MILRDSVNNAYLIVTVILRTQFVESTSNLTTMLSGTLKVLIFAFLNQFIIFETKEYFWQVVKLLDHMSLVSRYD